MIASNGFAARPYYTRRVEEIQLLAESFGRCVRAHSWPHERTPRQRNERERGVSGGKHDGLPVNWCPSLHSNKEV